MSVDPRVSTATPRTRKSIPAEATATFQTSFECPHCGRRQHFNGIAAKSGVVRCFRDSCQREFRINVPPYDSQFVADGFIDARAPSP